MVCMEGGVVAVDGRRGQAAHGRLVSPPLSHVICHQEEEEVGGVAVAAMLIIFEHIKRI